MCCRSGHAGRASWCGRRPRRAPERRPGPLMEVGPAGLLRRVGDRCGEFGKPGSAPGAWLPSAQPQGPSRVLCTETESGLDPKPLWVFLLSPHLHLTRPRVLSECRLLSLRHWRGGGWGACLPAPRDTLGKLPWPFPLFLSTKWLLCASRHSQAINL